jgi:hypothetical protein
MSAVAQIGDCHTHGAEVRERHQANTENHDHLAAPTLSARSEQWLRLL